MKKNKPFGELFYRSLKKNLLIMRIAVILMILGILQACASDAYSQNTKLSLNFSETELVKVLDKIEDESEFFFLYNEKLLDTERKVNITENDQLINVILDNLFAGTDVKYTIIDRKIILAPEYLTKEKDAAAIMQQKTVSGTVTDASTGEAMPGVNIQVKGTTIGAISDINGKFSIPSEGDQNKILVFSFIGYVTSEIPVNGRTTIDVALTSEVNTLDEVVVVGYGTMKKKDLTGSVVRADIEAFKEQPNVSLMQSLQGSVPGLNIDQITVAGQEPNISIRGTTSISGLQAPLIVLDGTIFRGNLIDINPNDIASVDILKDASSAAIYGSQASNGVILITTNTKGGSKGKPVINYSGYYSFQKPTKEFRPGDAEDYLKKTEESDILNSRTQESGYLERNPSWVPSVDFKTNEEINSYINNITTNWFDLLTNDNMYTQNHNLSMSNESASNSYYVSIGYTDQSGYMLNEGYKRINGRINIDNKITKWLKIGIQTFMTNSDYKNQSADPGDRYAFSPFVPLYDNNGEYTLLPGGITLNPFIIMASEFLDKRLNLFGNIYTNIDVPFIKGLSYKLNLSSNNQTSKNYYYRGYGSNYQGEGAKSLDIEYDWTVDNTVTFIKTVNKVHNINATFVYGVEKRQNEGTEALAGVFAKDELGYNKLQVGQSDLQQASSSAWEETSLYNMVRLFYGFKNKYLFTGTVRRDGFSGFGKQHKFGIFPSLSVAWVASEESFLNSFDWLSLLKFRASYGSVGNRTISRYQTLAKITGGFNYIKADGTSVFTQSISDLASPGLKWETTTGLNLGIDFGVFNNRITGTLEYYTQNTTDLLYNVDIPGIGRFSKFPDNLGRLYNQGIELTLSSVNIEREKLKWKSSFMLSSNKNELKKLLGIDANGDGKEDDLVSMGLFIGKPLDAIFTYKTTGELWQLGDVIPPGFDIGSYKNVDINGDGVINQDDRTIIGYSSPAYRFSISNNVIYDNWTLNFFINSIQGGKNHYMAADDLLGFSTRNSRMHFTENFPVGLDYWTPENTDARYERIGINVSSTAATRYMPRSFVRLQDVSLSYRFRSALVNKFKIQNLNIYVSGKNLLTLTKWPGFDPETGQKITPAARPVIKSYTMGVNVEF